MIRTMLSIICLILVRISIVHSRGNLVNCGKNFAKDCSSCHMGPLGFGFFKDKNYCNGECHWKKKSCFFLLDCSDCEKRPVSHNPVQVVHGGIGHWSSWTVCFQNCKSHRRRKCDNPVAQNGGKHCTGISRHESKPCIGGHCKSKNNNLF